MTDEFKDKTTIALQEVNNHVEKGEYLDAITIIDKTVAYMENYAQNPNVDPNWKLFYYDNYRNVWRLYRFILETRNDLETHKQEVNLLLKEIKEKLGL